MHGASEQCMQATEMDFSPGTPSFSVTTLRRFTPQGISCSCLQAVTQPLHSMQRSASARNFILAIISSSVSRSVTRLGLYDLAQRGLGFLHHGHDVVTIGRRGVDRLPAHHWRSAFRVLVEK